MFSCKYCNKNFARRFVHNRHIKEIHKVPVEPVVYKRDVWSFKCLEPDCDRSFQQGSLLVNHLERIHDLKFQNEIVFLDNKDAFTSWKQSMEEESCCYYVISKWNKQKDITYYNCNRSRTGNDKKRSSDKVYKRKVKRQGYYHINSSCTSQIKVHCDCDGKITVNFQRTHYGHEIEVSKIRVPNKERRKIAEKLINGVPPKMIVQDICNNAGKHLKRTDLLTVKDIGNIKRSFGIDLEDDMGHESDSSNSTNYPKEIFTRHFQGQSLINYTIENIGNVWKVTTKSGKSHTIQQNQEINCCVDICSVCNICRHIYTCTCEDSLLNKFICKHIHYLLLQTPREEVITENLECCNEVDLDMFCEAIDNTKKSREEKLVELKNNVICKLQNFDYSILDDSAVENIFYHLNIVQNIIDMSHNLNSEQSSPIINNKNNKRCIEPQLNFDCNKKKKKSCTSKESATKESNNLQQQQRQQQQTLSDHLYCKTEFPV